MKEYELWHHVGHNDGRYCVVYVANSWVKILSCRVFCPCVCHPYNSHAQSNVLHPFLCMVAWIPQLCVKVWMFDECWYLDLQICQCLNTRTRTYLLADLCLFETCLTVVPRAVPLSTKQLVTNLCVLVYIMFLLIADSTSVASRLFLMTVKRNEGRGRKSIKLFLRKEAQMIMCLNPIQS